MTLAFSPARSERGLQRRAVSSSKSPVLRVDLPSLCYNFVQQSEAGCAVCRKRFRCIPEERVARMTSKSGMAVPFEDLSSISRSINQASDSLTANISEFEAALSKFKLGVRASVNLTREEQERNDGALEYSVTYIESLEYCKHKGKWGLYVADFFEEDVDSADPDSYTITPLKDSPRELRLKAVEHFPELLKMLAKNGKEFAAEAARKSEQVRQIAANLNNSMLLNT
jgi:hypothetical protein